MKKYLYLITLLISLGTAVSCSKSGPEEIEKEKPTPTPQPEKEIEDPVIVSKGAYKHVILIGVDGGGAFFSQTVTPNSFNITNGGAFSYQTKTSYPTISAQCWGSMLHGVLPEFHRLSNEVVASRRYTDTLFPSIFRVVREAMPSVNLGSFCNWDPINYGIIEDYLNITEGTGNDPAVASQVINHLNTNDPTLIFVQFDSVDGAGHGNGYGSKAHLAQMTVVDGLIGQIYDAMVAKGIEDNTLFIITADHGGTPQGGHGGDTYAERYVFLGVSGKTVKNHSRIIDAEVRDIPAIAAYALGVDIPESWTGHVPSGLFPDVTAGERKEAVIPVSENRKHEMVPTPDLSQVQTLLQGHDVMAYFPFDGDASDAYGVMNTTTNGKVYYYNAYFSQGVALDDGYITLNDASFGTSSFSVSFWMKTNGVSVDPAIISNKNWGTGGNDGFVLSLRPSDIKFNAGDSAAGKRMDEVAFLPLDYKEGWVHVILTVDRAARNVKIYYDFKLEMDSSIPDCLADTSFDALNLNIGQDGTGSYSDHLAAQIDEMIITRDILSQNDIDALKNHYINAE